MNASADELPLPPWTNLFRLFPGSIAAVGAQQTSSGLPASGAVFCRFSDI